MQTIGIDARFYGTEQKGLGRYVQKLIEELERLNPPFHFKIFLSKKGMEQYQPLNKNFAKVLADVPWYGLREQIELPKILRREHCDLVHFPHFNVPYFYRRPYVITIHDLILFDHPSRQASKLSWPLYQAKYLGFKANLAHALAAAKKIYSVSEHTKERLAHYFPNTAEKNLVTYIAPGHASTQSALKPADLGITEPYILYVGNAYPHKNLEFLVSAFSAYQKEHHNLHLVLVGKLDYFYFRLQEKITNPAIRLFGYATEAQLATLYRHARAYVFPSLEEGFGIPPLEAMQYRVPVLSSNRGSMPEVLGDAALFFNPQSEPDFRKQLQMILTDEPTRQGLISRGLTQANKYSWKSCAERTLKGYQDAISRKLSPHDRI